VKDYTDNNAPLGYGFPPLDLGVRWQNTHAIIKIRISQDNSQFLSRGVYTKLRPVNLNLFFPAGTKIKREADDDQWRIRGTRLGYGGG
jgi:hypothetical protein